jgi:hypothetical protein
MDIPQAKPKKALAIAGPVLVHLLSAVSILSNGVKLMGTFCEWYKLQ